MADEEEIKGLKSQIESSTREIVSGHKSSRSSLESKLQSVLREYGNCSAISSSVRSIQELLRDADDDVRRLERDAEDILDGLEYTIRSTRDSQDEIEGIIRNMQRPSFDRLDVGGGRLHTNTNSIMVDTPNDRISDFLANSMIGGMPTLSDNDEVKIPSLIEQSTNKTPEINSQEDAKEYLADLELKRKLQEKYGHIKNQEDAKEQIVKEQYEKIYKESKVNEDIGEQIQFGSQAEAKEYFDEVNSKWRFENKYSQIQSQEDVKQEEDKAQDIDLLTGIGISASEWDTFTSYVNFKQSGFEIKQVANDYICIKGDYNGRANVPGVSSIKQNWYRVGSKEFNKSILSLYTENGVLSNKITPKRYLSNLPKAAKIEFKIEGNTLGKKVKIGTIAFSKDAYLFSDKSVFGKIGLSASYMGMVSGVFNQIVNNKDEDKKSDIHADIATEVVLDLGCMAAGTVGTKIGGSMGTALGPVGIATGAVMGFVVGLASSLLYSALFDTDDKKEGMSEWIEEKIDGLYGEEDM